MRYYLSRIVMLAVEQGEEGIGDKMNEAIQPEASSFFGLSVHPAFYTALIVSAILILAAVLIRIFAIPRFKLIPGKFQCILEKLVELFDGIVGGSFPNGNILLGGYCLTTGCFICFGTLIELIGLRPVMSDLNCCIAISLCTFGIILYSSIRAKGAVKGSLLALKDITVPISMSFRLFGAILSGYMVTELLYTNIATSIVLPTIVGVIFTMFHALIQAYVFAMLTTLFVGESSEPSMKKSLKRRGKAKNKTNESNSLEAVGNDN